MDLFGKKQEIGPEAVATPAPVDAITSAPGAPGTVGTTEGVKVPVETFQTPQPEVPAQTGVTETVSPLGEQAAGATVEPEEGEGLVPPAEGPAAQFPSGTPEPADPLASLNNTFGDAGVQPPVITPGEGVGAPAGPQAQEEALAGGQIGAGGDGELPGDLQEHPVLGVQQPPISGAGELPAVSPVPEESLVRPANPITGEGVDRASVQEAMDARDEREKVEKLRGTLEAAQDAIAQVIATMDNPEAKTGE